VHVEFESWGAAEASQVDARDRSAIAASRHRLRRFCRLRHGGWLWRRM
jgi:hypothetical protein